MYYAAHNPRADLAKGDRGFANTWEISRFRTKAERTAFILQHENQRARAVTRQDAQDIWVNNYRSVGIQLPDYSLFAKTKYGSNFWNENQA
jgi:hypothetical protein